MEEERRRERDEEKKVFVEREISLTLLNEKLNYLISKVEDLILKVDKL